MKKLKFPSISLTKLEKQKAEHYSEGNNIET